MFEWKDHIPHINSISNSLTNSGDVSIYTSTDQIENRHFANSMVQSVGAAFQDLSRDIWTPKIIGHPVQILLKYADLFWNTRTPTSAVLQVHFQVRRSRVQKKHRSDGSDIYHICLNYCSCHWIIPAPVIDHQARAERDIPRTMRVSVYLGGRGSTVNRSIARIAGAVKLTEIVIYDRSAVRYCTAVQLNPVDL